MVVLVRDPPPRQQQASKQDRTSKQPGAEGNGRRLYLLPSKHFWLIVLWAVCEFLSCCFGKYIASRQYFGFAHPFYLLTVQFIVISCAMICILWSPPEFLPAVLRPKYDSVSSETGLRVLPILVASVVSMILCNAAFGGHLSFVGVQTVKQVIVPVVAVFGVFFRTEIFSPIAMVSAVTILLGVAMFSYDHAISWGSFAGGLPLCISQVCEAVRLIGSQHLLQQKDDRYQLDWISLTTVIAVAGALVFGSLSFLFEVVSFDAFLHMPFWPFVFLLIFSTSSFMLSFHLLEHVSALSLLIVALARDLATIHLLEARSRPTLSLNWIAGYVIAVVGLRSLFRALHQDPAARYDGAAQMSSGKLKDFFGFIAPSNKRRQKYSKQSTSIFRNGTTTVDMMRKNQHMPRNLTNYPLSWGVRNGCRDHSGKCDSTRNTLVKEKSVN